MQQPRRHVGARAHVARLFLRPHDLAQVRVARHLVEDLLLRERSSAAQYFQPVEFTRETVPADDGEQVRLHLDGEQVAATPYRGEIAANTMYTASIGRNQEKHGDSFAGRTAHAVVDSVRVYDTALTRQQLEDDPAERAVLALDFETEQQNGEFLDYGSSNFVVNGLVNADRTPQPELAQLAYSHAPVRFEGTGEPGEFRVHNRNHTLTTEAYDLTWRLVEGGRDRVRGGDVTLHAEQSVRRRACAVCDRHLVALVGEGAGDREADSSVSSSDEH